MEAGALVHRNVQKRNCYRFCSKKIEKYTLSAVYDWKFITEVKSIEEYFIVLLQVGFKLTVSRDFEILVLIISQPYCNLRKSEETKRLHYNFKHVCTLYSKYIG
jgi:hypothetical protein